MRRILWVSLIVAVSGAGLFAQGRGEAGASAPLPTVSATTTGM